MVSESLKVSLMVTGVLLLLGGLGYLVFTAQNSEKRTAETIKGTAMPGLLMLTATNSSKEQETRSIYAHSFPDKKTSSLGWDLHAYTGAELTRDYSESPNGEWVIFAALRDRIEGEPLSEVESSWQLYRATYASLEEDNFTEALSNAERVTTATGLLYDPSISNRGEVLYTALPENEDVGAPIAASLGTIHYVDVKGDDQSLGEGISARWVDDYHFVYLKEDGLYIFNLLEEEEKKMLSLLSPVTTATTVGVSDDGTRVAIATVDKASLLLARISTSMDMAEGVMTIPVAGKSPVFLPNGEMVAIVTLAQEKETKQFTPILMMYNASTLKERALVPLSDFEPSSVTITDWFF